MTQVVDPAHDRATKPPGPLLTSRQRHQHPQTWCTKTPESLYENDRNRCTKTPGIRSDHHIETGRALYSIPGNLIGAQVDVRADSALVRVYHRGVLIKIHPRQAPGGRVTDADDLPAEKTAYAMRDLDHLRRLAAAEGPAIAAYADALLNTPLPPARQCGGQIGNTVHECPFRRANAVHP